MKGIPRSFIIKLYKTITRTNEYRMEYLTVNKTNASEPTKIPFDLIDKIQPDGTRTRVWVGNCNSISYEEAKSQLVSLSYKVFELREDGDFSLWENEIDYDYAVCFLSGKQHHESFINLIYHWSAWKGGLLLINTPRAGDYEAKVTGSVVLKKIPIVVFSEYDMNTIMENVVSSVEYCFKSILYSLLPY
jgi:hypothetical protein